MQYVITIEDCESINEFLSHLDTLKKQIKLEAKRLKLDMHKDALSMDMDLSDYNCYGSHEVEFFED